MASDSNDGLGSRGPERSSREVRALVPYPYPEGELDLVDVGVGLLRRWKLALAVFLLTVGATAAIAIFRKPVYQYSAVMTLGTVDALQGGHPFVRPESLIVQLEQVYIPQVLNRAAANGVRVAASLGIDAAVQPGSHAIAVAAKARPSDAAAVDELLRKVVAAASAATNGKLSAYLNRDHDYLRNEIERIQQHERDLEAQALQLSKTGAEGSAAASYVAAQVAALVQEEAGLRQQLQVLDPSNIEQAGLVGDITRSQKPVGLGKAATIGLGIVAALFLSLLAAVAASYFSAVLRRMQSPGTRNRPDGRAA